jgi:hypothetical protein
VNKFPGHMRYGDIYCAINKTKQKMVWFMVPFNVTFKKKKCFKCQCLNVEFIKLIFLLQ